MRGLVNVTLQTEAETESHRVQCGVLGSDRWTQSTEWGTAWLNPGTCSIGNRPGRQGPMNREFLLGERTWRYAARRGAIPERAVKIAWRVMNAKPLQVRVQ